MAPHPPASPHSPGGPLCAPRCAPPSSAASCSPRSAAPRGASAPPSSSSSPSPARRPPSPPGPPSSGSNGFTCSVLPDGTNAPFCGDKHAWAWFVAAFTGQPKPPNTEPGISYMMQGGVHYETPAGEIVMEKGPNTKTVQEPPHWMLMWPVDPATSGLPTRPNAGGVYVMFAGTPYAHLMVYQNPAAMK